jgi:hypothetical protein
MYAPVAACDVSTGNGLRPQILATFSLHNALTYYLPRHSALLIGPRGA